jgi:hypothetical protein
MQLNSLLTLVCCFWADDFYSNNAPANRRGEQEKVYLKDKFSNYQQHKIHARLAASG